MRSAILTAFIIATALFMENMDGTVIATSLPAIALDLHQDPIVLKLALTSYMLTLAVFIPASGWVADRFGARTVFCTAIVVFTLGSILCGASTSLSTLIAARVFQGLGGAMMVPVGRLVLLRSIPKSDLVSAMAGNEVAMTVPSMFSMNRAVAMMNAVRMAERIPGLSAAHFWRRSAAAARRVAEPAVTMR